MSSVSVEPKHAETAPSRHVARRRKDDATFAVIGIVLALFFLIEVGWVIVQRSHLGLL